MCQEAQHLAVLTANKPVVTCISHKYHVLFLWYISFQDTTLHVSTNVFTSESWHNYECE